jgi:ATP-dependent Clp protease ATP-binding subunit ClpC
MSTVSLSVPVLVQNIKIDEQWQYYIRPLFFQYPVATHRRLESAIQNFKSALRDFFKGFKLQRANLESLLWYKFNPKVKHLTPRLQFFSGKTQFIDGKFSIVHFQLQETHFICLPGFNSHTFIIDEADLKGNGIVQKAQEAIDGLIKSYKKQHELNNWVMDSHQASKGEFITTIELSIKIENAGFNFESSDNDWFFSFFSGNRDFNGESEIEQVGFNLNESYPLELKRAFYRDDIVRQLFNTVYHEENTPIVLVGPEGVGKHSLIHEVVYRYMKSLEDSEKQDYELQKMWHIDPGRIIAGMSVVGMWQKRFESILHYVQNRLSGQSKTNLADKILIDNPVALLRIGKSSQNSMTLSDVLKPYLENRTLQVILIASNEEWKLVQEKDRRFADLFQVTRVPEPKQQDALRMILELRKKLELDNDCVLSIPAVRQLFNIHRNYFKRRALPGSVAKLMTQIAVKFRHQYIDVEHVQEEFKHYSGLNAQIFDDNYIFEENEVRNNIDAALIGQPDAVESLTNVIHLIKARLQNPQKPLGSFLFIGPTGVGKTEAAKIICRYLLGDEDKILRFDMNEYIDSGAVSRLIGDYYNPEGQLTGKIRYNPFGIILFDEIEKAHPKVHDLLLQVLDDGRLTDSLGRTVDFVNTIIIMTSNVGASDVSAQLGFETSSRNEAAVYRKAVENFFRPEFVNRIDQIVIFKGLGLEHILEIAKLQIKQLLSRDGFVRRTTILNISPAALEWVAQRGYNEKMGGRALKRQIERDLTAFTADQLIKTHSDVPILFDIQLKEGKLFPRIEALDFVDPIQENWLPKVPVEKEMKIYYSRLLKKVEKLEDYLEGSFDDEYYEEPEDDDFEEEEEEDDDDDDDDNDDWMFYQLKNQLFKKKEYLKMVVLGFKSDYEDKLNQNVFRLKSAGTSSIIYKRDDSSKIEKILQKDLLFQQSALDELRYVYQNAPEQFERAQTAYIQDYVDIAYLNMASQAASAYEVDQIEIHIESVIQGQGMDETDYLKSIYSDLLNNLDLSYKLLDNCIEVDGYAVYDLLKNEQGFHLFYRSHQNSLPIRVIVCRAGEKKYAENSKLKVLRLYDICLGVGHKSSTMTDLRSAYTNQANITVGEFKVLIFGGLDAADRG